MGIVEIAAGAAAAWSKVAAVSELFAHHHKEDHLGATAAFYLVIEQKTQDRVSLKSLKTFSCMQTFH